MVAATALLAFALADAGSVRIATTVTDRQGRPVSGLAAKDFQIKEDGVVRTVDTVEPRKPEPRRIAILLDEFHVEPGNTARVRQALTAFVDARLRDGDVALVLKPLDPLTAIRLTPDRESLRLAIAGFEGRKGLYEPRTLLEEETMGRAPALVEASRAQVVLSALRALTAQLGAAPGRSAILVVTEGFASPARRSTLRGLPDANIVERFANRYDVPIYAFDPREAAGTDDAGAAMLARLAQETGGTLSRGPDLIGNVSRAAAELDAGYTLVFTSAHGDDGRYHPVQVLVTRGEADARARAGYVSGPSDEMRRAMRALAAPDSSVPSRLLHRSPLVQIWSGVTSMTPGEARVAVTWEPGTGPAGTGKSPAARVTLKATTPDGKVLFDGVLSPVRSGGSGDTERAEFNTPPGRVQLDMTVLGISGQKLDTDVRDLEVQAPRDATPLLLPPALIATQSAREFRDAIADASASPVPAREFRRTERVLVRVPAYGTSGAVPVSARLLNRVGQTMKVLDVLPTDAPGVTQFDLPLAPLAPGDYFLLISIQGPSGPIAQRIPFKITG